MARPRESEPGARLRAVLAGDRLWLRVKERARAEGVTISEVVRRAIAAYLTTPPRNERAA